MRSSIVLPAAFAAAAYALPQGFDWDVISSLEPVAAPTIPVVNAAAQATTVSNSVSAAVSSISASIAASGVATTTDDASEKLKRAASTDTASAFLNNPVYGAAASAAPIPSGYTQQFVNLNASNSAYGYQGYTVLSEYDVEQCASLCNNIDGCASINIYYERDPSVDPTSSNPDPASEVVIKCVFWSGPVTAENAQNSGQWRDDFQVVIAGSNGYLNNTIAPVTGYAEPIPLGNAAINAPLDCNDDNTYMGVKIWTTGAFSPALCAAACTATSEYDVAQGLPTAENPQTCQFFNTYILSENGIPVGQYCAMYNQTWSSSYATNVGQYDGSGNHYTISHSYIYSNATDAGTCKTN